MNSNKLSFLVIDDISSVCERIISIMKNYPKWHSFGYETFVHKAIANITLNKPCLLFLDWKLLGGNAFSILEHISTMKNYNPYIIFNTAHLTDDPGIVEEAINIFKVDKFITVDKPAFGKLFEKIDDYLKEAEMKSITLKEEIEVWVNDEHGIKVRKNLIMLASISHLYNQNKKALYFADSEHPLISNMTWNECYDFLDNNRIDYFITNKRESIITRNHISKIDFPYVYMLQKNLKFTIVKERKKAFEEWMKESY